MSNSLESSRTHQPHGQLHVRRRLQLVERGSSAAVVQHVIRAALAPSWTPAGAAAAVTEAVRADVVALRQARARLRSASHDRFSIVEGRAVATLNLAITELERHLGTHHHTPPQRNSD